VNPLTFPLLTDENVHPEVARALAANGKNVTSARDEGLEGKSDLEVLRKAHSTGRVVLTHDGDFGTLVIRDREPFTGIIYLRPGHIQPSFVLDMLRSIETSAPDVTPSFLLVAERRGSRVRIRLRSKH